MSLFRVSDQKLSRRLPRFLFAARVRRLEVDAVRIILLVEMACAENSRKFYNPEIELDNFEAIYSHVAIYSTTSVVQEISLLFLEKSSTIRRP